MSSHIVVPDERYAQLEALKIALGCDSLADTIGVMINHEIEAGNLANAVPGFRVRKHGGKVAFALDGLFERTLAKAEAMSLAGSLAEELDPQLSSRIELNLDAMLIVVRKGNGMKIKDPDTKLEKAISLSIARDLANLLRQAAA